MIIPRHTLESIVKELREGLEEGSIVLSPKASMADAGALDDASLLEFNRQFISILDMARNRVKVEGLRYGKPISDEELQSALRLVRNASLNSLSSWPLRRETILRVSDRVYFNEILVGESVRSLTLTRDIASPVELTSYLKALMGATVIETSVSLESA